MDIRKIMTMCAGCVPSTQMCMPMQAGACQPFFTDCSEDLIEDGGICLADYSPNGELLSSLCNLGNFQQRTIESMSSSSTSSAFSDHSFQASNEALAEKISMLSTDRSSTDSSSYLFDADKQSFTSLLSNEGEAITISSNSFEWCNFPNRNTESMRSFTESICGGEDLAEDDDSSSESSELFDSLEGPNASTSSSLTNKDSLSLDK